MHLYIHIPFCKNKCSYCDFVSGSYPTKTQDAYTNALILELKQILEKISPDRFKTIYIGGGTPSSLSRENIEKLLQTLSCIDPEHLEEFTMECNPESVNEELILLMKKYKVRRVSLGVQSANEEELRFLDRIHSFEQVEKVVGLLQKHDIQNISLDLIFDLPNQTMELLQRSMDEFIALKPSHISCYSLIIEPGTPMMKWLEEGRITVGSDDNYVMQQRFITEYLAKHDYHQYEISNYAKEGFEAIHNSAYWSGNDYIGAGISAHSKQGNYRYANICDIDDYILRIHDTKSLLDPKIFISSTTKSELIKGDNDTSLEVPLRNSIDPDSIDFLSAKDQLNELFFLGLRRNIGISKQQIEQKILKLPAEKQRSAKDHVDQNIEKFLNQKLLQQIGDLISLTQEGREISNTIFVDLML